MTASNSPEAQDDLEAEKARNILATLLAQEESIAAAIDRAFESLVAEGIDRNRGQELVALAAELAFPKDHPRRGEAVMAVLSLAGGSGTIICATRPALSPLLSDEK